MSEKITLTNEQVLNKARALLSLIENVTDFSFTVDADVDRVDIEYTIMITGTEHLEKLPVKK